MRLKETQVKMVCQKVVEALRGKHLITLKRADTEILAKMEEIFLRELRIEDDIDREAEKILEQYARQMGDQIDRQKMLQLIKKQIVKDRKVIL